MRLSQLLVLALPLCASALGNGKPSSLPNDTFISSTVVAPRLNILQAHPQPQRALFTLLSQRSGPVILDSRGRMVWRPTKWPNAHNLQVQEYKAAPYLTFWSGAASDDNSGHARGYYHMLDSSYRHKLRVRATNGLFGDWGDKNEFYVTRHGTALMTIYEKTQVDLWAVSMINRRGGWIWDCIFQEIDLESQKVVFRWRASEVFALEHSSTAPVGNQGSDNEPWDWYHLNSVDRDATGNYLVSARHASAISYISGEDGSAIWTLGGKDNDFVDKSNGGADFTWPSDVRWHDEGVISLFDAGSGKRASRGLLLSLDLKSFPSQVSLRQSFAHPDGVSGNGQGSMQVLENGNVVVGWGLEGSWTEFTANGSVVEDVRYQPTTALQSRKIQPHRTYKMSWKGVPKTTPSLVIRRSSAYVSWNGATEVNHWRLQCTHSYFFRKESDWVDVVSEERQGFETVLDFDQIHLKKWVRVLALDTQGNILGITRTVDWRSARKSSSQTYFIFNGGSLVWIGSIAVVLLLVLLRFSRRYLRRCFMLRGSKRRGSNGLMYKSLPTASPI